MNSPTPRRTRELRTLIDPVSLLVFAVVFANAATQFAIQAWMTFRFATDVWEIPEPLCIALIFALDLFAVMFMVFTYLLRDARKRTKAYVWAIFALGVGAQLFAAELYGDHKDWANPVRIFAGLPSLFLAASLHGLIIWRRHRSDDAHPAVAKRAVPDAAKTDPGQAPKIDRPPRPDRAPEPPPVSSGAGARKSRRNVQRGGPSDEAKDDAIRQVLAGTATPKDLAPRLGVSKRAVEIWVQHARAASAGQRLADAITTTHPASPQVNGHRPEAEVKA